jgi:hypothetical protein
MKEIWKDIPGYENYYQVSNIGRIKGIKRKLFKNTKLGFIMPAILEEKYLSSTLTKQGYHRVCLCVKSMPRKYFVHYLVMMSFVGLRPKGAHVNHKNGITWDNRLENLEYATPDENIRHYFDHLREKKSPFKVLKESEVFEIREMLLKKITGVDIAKKFNVHKSAIYNIKNKKTWKHLK